MSISAISANSSMSQMNSNNPMAKMKQLFDDLGSALQSGNLTDAKKAFDELQRNAPSQRGDSNNPMSTEIEKLGNALDSGDMEAAQEAYSAIQDKMSQGPPAGGAAGGRPPQGQGATADNGQIGSGSSQSTDSQSDTKVYDKKDTNKDGTVSIQEELAYSS